MPRMPHREYGRARGLVRRRYVLCLTSVPHGTTLGQMVPIGTILIMRRGNEGAAIRLLREHRIQRDRVGNRRNALHLAATPPSRAVRGPATSARPPHLPLYRAGLPGPGRGVA